MIEIQKEWYTIEDCLNNPNKLYVFGDNTLRLGNGGQARIRDIPNCFGIATKLSPSVYDNSYFSDKHCDFEYVYNDIYKLYQIHIQKKYDFIVFPYDGLGTGLSQMPERSPTIYKWMNDTISLLFNIKYPPEE